MSKKWWRCLPVASDKLNIRPKATRAISLHWRLHNGVMTSVYLLRPLGPAFCSNHKVWHCIFEPKLEAAEHWLKYQQIRLKIERLLTADWRCLSKSGTWEDHARLLTCTDQDRSCCKWMARSAIDMNIVALTQALQPPLSSAQPALEGGS